MKKPTRRKAEKQKKTAEEKKAGTLKGIIKITKSTRSWLVDKETLAPIQIKNYRLLAGAVVNKPTEIFVFGLSKKEKKLVPLFIVAKLKNIVLPKSRRGRVYKIWNLQRNTHFKVFQGQKASEIADALVQAWEKINGKG